MPDNGQTKLSARHPVADRYRTFAKRWRMTITDTVEFGIENLERLTPEEVASRMERRPAAAARRARKATVATAQAVSNRDSDIRN